MRIKLTLTPVNSKVYLPINYNYFLTGLIYKIIRSSSKDYSSFLHDEGYKPADSKNGFKLFAFSMLMSRNTKILGNEICFQNGNIIWQITSPIDEFIWHLVTGVFEEGQKIKIGREGSEAVFNIKQVESLPGPKFSETMRFTCISPITVSKNVKDPNGLNSLNGLNGSKSNKCHYIRPWEPDFPDAVRNNLIKKHKLVHGKDIKDTDFTIKIDQEYMNKKSGRITKNINFKGTNIIGFMAPFEVTGNPRLLEIGYSTGFGEKGSMGFGMVKQIV